MTESEEIGRKIGRTIDIVVDEAYKKQAVICKMRIDWNKYKNGSRPLAGNTGEKSKIGGRSKSTSVFISVRAPKSDGIILWRLIQNPLGGGGKDTVYFNATDLARSIIKISMESPCTRTLAEVWHQKPGCIPQREIPPL